MKVTITLKEYKYLLGEYKLLSYIYELEHPKEEEIVKVKKIGFVRSDENENS